MNLRLGRTGVSEGVAVSVTAMTVCSIFSFESKLLYERGNSTYLTLPCSILLSLLIFLLLAAVMKRTQARSLGMLFENALGRVGFSIIAIAFLLLFAYSAYAPLSQFIRAMHGLFFDGVSYSRIVVFTMLPVLIASLLGFETIGRTAKLIAPLLFAVLAATTLASSVEFELYRLYPLLGNGAEAIAVQVLEETFTFLPALLCLLINADGLNGIESARRAGIFSALIAAVISLVCQLALGLCYTYSELGDLFMPMFRINYLNKFEAHFMRMDKLAHMIWLGGAMMAGAYYLYSGARLFCGGFRIKDIRPAIVGASALTVLMTMTEVEGRSGEEFLAAKQFTIENGYILLSAILIISGLIALAKSSLRRKNV